MSLSPQEREEIIAMIEAGQALPSRYRASLFEDLPSTELVWPGKSLDVERVVLPFQSVEHIDEPRAEQVQTFDLFSLDAMTGRQSGGWTNKLIWGDNKLILSSLAHGSLRKEIEAAGGLKLAYIDPPFDVGADFSIDVEVGETSVTKKASVIEEIAYRDTWGKGRDSFASMLYERLLLIHSLLDDDGSLFVHCDYRLAAVVRLILDEIFGADNFVNQLIWHYNTGGATKDRFSYKHDVILYFAKDEAKRIFTTQREPYREDATNHFDQVDEDGRRFRVRTVNGKDYIYYLDEGRICHDVWDIDSLNASAIERLGYPTQKPEALLRRIIGAASREGDLVTDFFCGSGTTLAVAEKMGRKWLGSDLGRFALHTSRKRLIQVQRELKAAGSPFRSFEILNLGLYDKSYFLGIDPGLESEEKARVSAERERLYHELVLEAYGARPSDQLPPFHGSMGGTAVFVGPIDAPVSARDVQRVIDAARAAGITRADILGFEFEMGIKPTMIDDAQELGVALSLRYIPADVFDRRAIAKGQVNFYNVGYVEADCRVQPGLEVVVSLTDFGVFYAQEDADAVAAGLRKGKSKIIVDQGQVVRVAKDKAGVTTREVLTQSWTDWIDYWAVDFNFESQKELVRVGEGADERQEWTGRFIFENEWQAFRTRRDRSLEMESVPHRYDAPGTYRVAVKVIDVFGNDTTKVVPVKVK